MYKRLKSPLSAQLEVTGECNHTCQHCYNFWRDKDKSHEMSPKKTSAFMSKDAALVILKKLSDAEVFSVVITGGEPLLNLSLCLECIKFARLHKMEVGMNSNLTPLTEDGARRLKDAGLKHILTSILGPNAEIHDSITQHPNSFDLLIKKIKIARNAGIRVTANMVVSQLNNDHVRSTAQLVSSLGITSFTATKAGKPGNCSDFSGVEISRERLVRFLNDLCWVQSNLGMRVDVLEPIPLCGLVGVEKPELFMSRRCNAGITTVTVSSDGSVRPCSHLDISYGNLLEEDISSIWARMDPWRKGDQVPYVCRGCQLLSLCGSGCRMEGKSRTGRIDGLDPYTSTEDIPQISHTLKERRCCKTKAQKVGKFKTAKFRLRREDFGGVVSSSGNKRVLLDQAGFEVLLQMRPETCYDISSDEIDWKGLDPSMFISNLLSKNVVTTTERR